MTHDFHLNVNLNVNILKENAYAQQECAHDSFKKKHEPAYNELTNAKCDRSISARSTHNYSLLNSFKNGISPQLFNV